VIKRAVVAGVAETISAEINSPIRAEFLKYFKQVKRTEFVLDQLILTTWVFAEQTAGKRTAPIKNSHFPDPFFAVVRE
jgi:hypothetical protein